MSSRLAILLLETPLIIKVYTREYVHRKEIGQAKLSTCHIVLKIVCLTHLAIKIGNQKLPIW